MPTLSPNGRYLAGLRQEGRGGTYYLVTADLDSENTVLSTTPLDVYDVYWLRWATDNRLLLGVKSTDREVVRIRNRSVNMPPTKKIIAMDRGGGNKLELFADLKASRNNQRLAMLTNILRKDPEHIIAPLWIGGALDLFKVNISTGKYWRIASGGFRTQDWYTDSEGRPVIRIDINRRRTEAIIYTAENQPQKKTHWKERFRTRLSRLFRQRGDFSPLIAGLGEETFYVLARPEGHDVRGLHIYNHRSGEFVQAVKELPGFDIRGALFEGDNYVGVSYWSSTILQHEFNNPRLQAHYDGLTNYFGPNVNIMVQQQVRNGERWLLFTEGSADSGSYHIYDKPQSNVRQIASFRPSLDDKQLGSLQTISFKAADGLPLTGYLTRPKNASSKTPLIVMPHGGPAVRDRVEFNAGLQFLVARGYQVLQVNFRGSRGFGKEFEEQGHRQWGKLMQSDIEDGVNEVLRQNLASADNLCISGSSYGGYVALVAATTKNTRYKCSVSVAGVSDLRAQLRFDRREEGANSLAYKYWLKSIGHPKKDAADLIAHSPSENVTRSDIPVLLIHGQWDDIVPHSQSERMEKALKTAGRDVKFISMPSDHHFATANLKAAMLSATYDFLKMHLPVSEDENTGDQEPTEKSAELKGNIDSDQ